VAERCNNQTGGHIKGHIAYTFFGHITAVA